MNRSNLLVLTPVAIFTVLGLCSSGTYAQSTYNETICGPIVNNTGTYVNGPYDYRKTTQANKDMVEKYHFNYMEKILGNTKERDRIGAWDQFEYTLRIFPNSPRALVAIDRLSRILKRDQPPGAKMSAECAFLRAEQFTPDDPMVRVLHGIYLGKRGRSAEAAAQLEVANKLAPGNPSIQYNLGLGYFQIDDYPHAREHAAIAYDAGFPLPGLREMLKRAGYWEVKSRPDQLPVPVSAVSPHESTPKVEAMSPSKPDADPPANQR